jgi:hypothetical protein
MTKHLPQHRYSKTFAEFFAGIGLMLLGPMLLEQ